MLTGNVVSGTKEPTERAIAASMERAQSHYLVKGALVRIVVLVAALFLLFSSVFGVAVVNGDAMRPTAGDGDIALFSRLDRTYHPDDLVVFDHDGTMYVGRVVAGTGTSVEVTTDGDLKLNGNVQDRKYGQPTMPATDGPTYPIVLGAQQLFVVGDNREGARDSREFGPISVDDVQGKVITLMRSRGL